MKFHFYEEGDRMNTGCFKCDKAQWDADGCTCEITGRLVGDVARGCEYRKDIEPQTCPFCGGKAANCTKQYDGRIYRYRIQCDNAGCACRTPWLCYQEDAIDVWNRRAENDNR